MRLNKSICKYVNLKFNMHILWQISKQCYPIKLTKQKDSGNLNNPLVISINSSYSESRLFQALIREMFICVV